MSGGGGATVVSIFGMKKTIQDIREIAGQHSDEDIYAMLKECSMDPNETAQRLLHLDTFHEVKKKHGRRKENVDNRAFENPGRQPSARLGRGAKVDRGNFHFQNTSQNNGGRFLGGSKESGYKKENGHSKTKLSKGHHIENKSAPHRPDHVKVNGAINLSNGKNINGGAPSNENVSSSGDNLLSASLSDPPASSKSVEDLRIDVALSPDNAVPGDQNADCNCKIQNGDPTAHVSRCIGTPNTQLTDSVGNGQGQLAICSAKDVKSKEADNHVEDCKSENDVSVVLEEASKLNISDGQHVVFPEHLQVPEAYKKKLTFGSFDSIWAVDGKQAYECNVMDSNILVDVDGLASKSNAEKSTAEGNGVIFSITKDAQESEDPIHLHSPSPMSGSATPIAGHALPSVFIKTDEPETENLFLNGSREPSKLANNGFGYASQAYLQAHNNAEPQDENFTAFTSSIGPTGIINPPGSTHDFVSTPPPAPILRQSYHPNFFPYGHYYPQFIVPQVQQYMTHGGLPQPPSVVNPYLTSAAAAGIKYPQQQSKRGANAGTESYIGVPLGYSPYMPYVFPYGLPPVVMPGDIVGDNDHETQSKENSFTHTAEQQIESSGEWTGGTGRTVSGMQVSPLYSFGLGQGHPHPMVFSPTPAAYGAFGGVYNPSVQTIPAPQSTLNSQIHQPQSIGPGETALGAMPPAGFYQQQQKAQGANIIWNSKQ